MLAGPELAMAAAAALVLVGVLASKLSARSGIPALLLFLAIGMLAGSDGPGGVGFEDVDLAQSLGIVALAFILFDGGPSTDWGRVRPVRRDGVILAAAGVAATALIVGWAASVAPRHPAHRRAAIGRHRVVHRRGGRLLGSSPGPWLCSSPSA